MSFPTPDAFKKLSEISKHFTCEFCSQHPHIEIDINWQQGSLGTKGQWLCKRCNSWNTIGEKESEYLFRAMGMRMPFGF